MYAIVVSDEDSAGSNIKDKLLKSGRFEESSEAFDGHAVYSFGDKAKLYTLKTLHIHTENLHLRITADSFIFATTHRSSMNIHSLSVHTIGNWGPAEMGGREKTVCPVDPALVAKLFRTLNEEGKDLDYEITMEVTHHGPFIEKPITFIEIGSQAEQWNDPAAGEAIARTIIRTLDEELPSGDVGFGVGGTHYCARFNRRLLEGEFLLSQVCPKYALEHFDEEMLAQCLKKSTLPIKYALLDWKGMGKEKDRVVSLLEQKKIEIKKLK